MITEEEVLKEYFQEQVKKYKTRNDPNPEFAASLQVEYLIQDTTLVPITEDKIEYYLEELELIKKINKD